jgi:hypothetical protein
MVGRGSRSSFDWWYFQKDWSSFEFSFSELILYGVYNKIIIITTIFSLSRIKLF